jgi:hypothetical protein
VAPIATQPSTTRSSASSGAPSGPLRGVASEAQAVPSRADSMLAVGRLRAAEDALYAAVAASPRTPAPRGALGRYLASRGRFPIAQVLYEEALRFGADRGIVARAIADMRPYRPDSGAARSGAAATVRFVFAEDGRFVGALRATTREGRGVTVVIDPGITGFAVRTADRAPAELLVDGFTVPVRTPRSDPALAEDEVRAGVDLLWRHGFLFDERAGTITLGGRVGRMGGTITYVPVVLTFPGMALVPRPGIAPIPMERDGARRLVRGARWWLDAEQGALVVER